MYHENVNVNLIVENVTRVKQNWYKDSIKIKVSASVKIRKNILCAKKIIFGILLDSVVKRETCRKYN